MAMRSDFVSGNFGDYRNATLVIGVRPVISLKSTVELQGNGTISSPYEVIS